MNFWITNVIDRDTAEILIYGFITEQEVNSSAFVYDLKQLEQLYTNINIRLNSGGGNVFEGIAIFNAIRNSKAFITIYIDGMAASMASVISLAGKKTLMSKYARLMTHRVNGVVNGDADQVRQYAEMMESLEDTLASIYSERTGLTLIAAKEKYLQPGKDRWLTAEQALTEKLINGIYDTDPVDVPISETDPRTLWNTYSHLYNTYQTANTNMKRIAITLGLPENSSEQEITNALSKLQTDYNDSKARLDSLRKVNAQTLVEEAITQKKITADKKEAFINMAVLDYEGAKVALSMIQPYIKPTDLINTYSKGAANPNTADQQDSDINTWDDLINKGNAFVATYKVENGASYIKLYQDKYKRLPIMG